MAADRVIRGASEVVSMPLSADLMLPETSGVSCVSVPTLAGVGEDTGSRKIGPCPGGLKGVFTTVSSCWRKEERTKETGVDKKMGSGVGPEGGVGNSRIRSIICSSGPVCTTSIRAGGVGVRDALSSSSSSRITSLTPDSTKTSLVGADSSSRHVLGSAGAPVLLKQSLLALARKVPFDPVLWESRLSRPSPILLGSKLLLRSLGDSLRLWEALLVRVRRRGPSYRRGAPPSCPRSPPTPESPF